MPVNTNRLYDVAGYAEQSPKPIVMCSDVTGIAVQTNLTPAACL